MRKVLIADTSDQWRELLEQALSGQYLVRSCADGVRTLELAEQFEPDVLILDLLLAGTDGLTVLKNLSDSSVKPRVIVTGKYFSNFITATLDRYQVDDILMKPCAVPTVVERIGELLDQQEQAAVTCLDPYDFITGLLVSLGAPTSQQGFRFLRTGILLLMEDPGQQLTKSLYPAIAAYYRTSDTNVEKGLRTTVAAAWANRRDSIWRNYFSPAPNGQIPKPTAGQFLTRLTDVVLSVNRKQA